jgi:Ca-activated chloride channel family protein
MKVFSRRTSAIKPEVAQTSSSPLPVSPAPARMVLPAPPRQQQIAPRLLVVSAQGLDAGAIASLNQYLQSVNLPAGVSGETVWDVSIQDGRVVKVAILFVGVAPVGAGFANDTQTSTLQSTDAIESLKAALNSWQPPAGLKGTLRLKLLMSIVKE